MMAQQQRIATSIQSLMRLLVVLVLLLGCWPTIIKAQPPSSYQDGGGDEYYNNDGIPGGGYNNDPQNYGDPSYEQEYAQDSLYHDYAARLEQKAAGCVPLQCGIILLRLAVDRLAAKTCSCLAPKTEQLYMLTLYQ
jgi:hypothetical protein